MDLTHLIRRCNEMIATAARPATACFPATVMAVLQKALLLRDERDAGVLAMCRPRKSNRDNERLAGFCYRHAGQLFTFLRHPGTDATNWRGEHAMRSAVMNRKVWGGNRTRRTEDQRPS